MDKLVRYGAVALMLPFAFAIATFINTFIVAMLAIAAAVFFIAAIAMLLVGLVMGPFVFTYSIIKEAINKYDLKS